MVKVIEVIYENGVFKPLEKVDLPEKSRFKIRIEEDIEKLAEEFAGIGKYKGKLTKEKLHEIEVDLFG